LFNIRNIAQLNTPRPYRVSWWRRWHFVSLVWYG